MKILHTVEFYSPSVGGAQEVVRRISECLLRRGHEVTVATTRLAGRSKSTVDGVHVEEFEISGNAVGGFHGETRRYQEFLQTGRFDVMMNYAAQQWATDLVFTVLGRLPYRKILAPCGFSALFDPQYRLYFSQMPEVMRRYDNLVFHSDMYRDIQFAKRHGISHYAIIPNGASQNEFGKVDPTFRQRYGIPSNMPLLLTVGSHTGLKGHALVIEAFRRAHIGRAVLMIVGNTIGGVGCLRECQRRALWSRVRSAGRKQVLLLQPPREDIVGAYHAADLFVFGSNIECSPIVLFEAMASKTAFVTVECGNAGEIVAWSRGGVTVPTEQFPNGYVHANPECMARAIENLVHHRDVRVRLAETGYQAWKERFTWEKISLEYERLYQALLEGMPIRGRNGPSTASNRI